MYCESFDSDRNFGACIVNHLIQIRTLEHVLWIIWFRSELWSMYCESFDSDQNFGACTANHLIQIRTLEHVLRIVWFRLKLWSGFGNLLANWINLCAPKSWSEMIVCKLFKFSSELRSAHYEYLFWILFVLLLNSTTHQAFKAVQL